MASASLAPALCALLTLGSCGATPDRSAARPSVIVSLPPQIWLVEAIGGPSITAMALVGPGESAETYSPTDAQVSAALQARVYFRIGAPFEQAPWFRSLSAAPLEIVDLRTGVDLLPLDHDGTAAAGTRSGDGRAAANVAPGTAAPPDPHIWLSPRRLAVQAETVAAALSRLDPSHRANYERGLDRVTRELESLDRELALALRPYRGRSFFIQHPSFGYFARDYGLRQIAIEVEGHEPTDRDLTLLLASARAEHIRTLFVAPGRSDRLAMAVAAATGAAVVRLDPLEPDVPAGLRRVARRLIESFSS